MDSKVESELEAARSGPITVDITTTGRNSGTPRRIEIWIVNVDGHIIIGGTPGPRDWLANLKKDPRLIVHFKETTAVDLAATARIVEEPATKRLVYEHPATKWYRQQEDLETLIADGPTIALSFDDAAS